MVGFRPFIGDDSAPPPPRMLPPRATPSPNPRQAVQTWSYRVPSPPRVYVPPPSVKDEDPPELRLAKRTAQDFDTNGFDNADFLKSMPHNDAPSRDHILEWEYEERRMAQQILPYLYLGPVSAARDREFLVREEISMVMAVRDTLSAQARLLNPKAPRDLGLHSVNIDVSGNQQLIAAFPRAIEEINCHLSARYQANSVHLTTASVQSSQPVPGKVLVFCESGNDRSVAVVVAYIMAMYSATLVDALQVVQSQRFCISVDDSCRYLLKSYEGILAAKRDVVKAVNQTRAQHTIANLVEDQHTSISALNKGSKRNLDETYEDSMDIEEESEAGVMEMGGRDQRGGRAPFSDEMA